jgi:hypothetical protein
MPRSRYTSASPAPIDMRAELRTTAHVPKHDCQAPRGSRGTVRAVHGLRNRVADGHEGFDGEVASTARSGGQAAVARARAASDLCPTEGKHENMID